MNHKKAYLASVLLAVSLLSCFCLPAFAADVKLDCTTDYTFSQADFFPNGDVAQGIYLMEVPKTYEADLCIGSRTLCRGDVLPAAALDYLKLVSNCTSETDCNLVYCPIQDGNVMAQTTMQLHIFTGSNTAPICENSTLETYKNLSNHGTLKATDEQNEAMTYQLVKEPKRGTVELHEDGSFTYTPDENKVGRDKFVFTATDASGNISDTAEVRIHILKPSDKAYYQDMKNEDGAFEAMWLKEQGYYCGKQVAGQLLFEPDAELTRGEFLTIAMQTAGVTVENTVQVSAFDDASATAQWQQSYVTTALQKGWITGTQEDNMLFFRPNDTITKAEAAVMLQKIYEIPDGDLAVFSEDTEIPAWSRTASAALREAGISLDAGSLQPMTNLDAAKTLYACFRYQNQA